MPIGILTLIHSCCRVIHLFLLNILVLTLFKFLCIDYRGDCGSCTLSVGGTRVKACVGLVPPEPRLKSLIEKGLEIK